MTSGISSALSILSYGTQGAAPASALPAIATKPPEPATVRRARQQFDVPATDAPWARAVPSRAAELLRQPVGRVARLDSAFGPAELQPIRDAWTLVDRMRSLANAAAGQLSATDRTAAAERFEALSDALRTRLAGAHGRAEIFFGQPAHTVKTTTGGMVVPASFAGREVTATRGDTLALQAGAALMVRLDNAAHQAQLTVPLDGATTLDAVAERLNAAIAAAPGSHAARFALERGDTGWRLALRGNGEDVTLADNSRVVAGLVRPGSGGSLGRADAAGRAVVGGLPFDVRAATGDANGNAWVAGVDSAGAARLAKLDASGAVVWQQALPEGTQPVRLETGSSGVMLLAGGEAGRVFSFDAAGQRIGDVALASGADALAALPGDRVAVATRDAEGRPRLQLLDAKGTAAASAALAGRGTVTQLLAADTGAIAAASLDGQARLLRLDAGLGVAAEVTLGSGRIAGLVRDGDALLALQVAPDGSRRLHRLAADTLAVQESRTLDFAATGLAVTADGVALSGRQGGDFVVAQLDPDLSEQRRDRWPALGEGEPLLFGWRAGQSALAALGLRGGQATDGDGTAVLARGRPLDPKPGDSMTIATPGGDVTIHLEADDTLRGLARRIAARLGSHGTARVAETDGRQQLLIEARTVDGLALRPGPDGRDLLGALGLEERRLSAVRVRGDKDPLVRPGGSFALKLDGLPGIGTRAGAAASAKQLDAAEATLRSAWRSLFWDDAKAAIATGPGATLSAADKARLANYTEALRRLGGPA